MKLIIDIPDKTNAHIRSDYGHGVKGLYDEDREILCDAIYNGTPYEERPHGEWVHTTVGNTEFINCKNCGCPLYSYVKKGEKEEKIQHYETDFCPNCGADMREGEAK